MAASYAVFSLAVLIWATPSGKVIEPVVVKQISPTPFAVLNDCRDDLLTKITARLAAAAHVVADAVKTSANNVAGNHLVVAKDTVRCLRVPVTADVLDALTE